MQWLTGACRLVPGTSLPYLSCLCSLHFHTLVSHLFSEHPGMRPKDFPVALSWVWMLVPHPRRSLLISSMRFPRTTLQSSHSLPSFPNLRAAQHSWPRLQRAYPLSCHIVAEMEIFCGRELSRDHLLVWFSAHPHPGHTRRKGTCAHTPLALPPPK